MIVPFHKISYGNAEIESVVKVLKNGWLTMGDKTFEFENSFSKYVGSKEAIAVNSATAALHLAVKAVGISKGDEVILPTTTFVSTIEVLTYVGAIPILCDVEYDTHNIDVSKIKGLITNKTKAIIPVHFGGNPCDMNEIYKIKKTFNLKIIEDAAHAPPSFHHGNPIGGLNETDITCFSFYATKTLSTGEGGMAVTSNSKYANRMRVARLHGISQDAWNRYKTNKPWKYDVIDNGYKYNISDISSSLGLIQLDRQEEFYRQREFIARCYNKAFKNVPEIEVINIKPENKTSWHLYVIKVNNRDTLIEKLKSIQIGSSVHFIPIHLLTYYRKKYGFNSADYPVANKVYMKSVSLPIFPSMSKKQVDFVIKSVINYADDN